MIHHHYRQFRRLELLQELTLVKLLENDVVAEMEVKKKVNWHHEDYYYYCCYYSSTPPEVCCCCSHCLHDLHLANLKCNLAYELHVRLCPRLSIRLSGKSTPPSSFSTDFPDRCVVAVASVSRRSASKTDPNLPSSVILRALDHLEFACTGIAVENLSKRTFL